MEFKLFQTAVSKQFKKMSEHRLFASTADSADLWGLYLSSFPAGSNPIYKARTEHDCSCCRRFIKVLGGVVNIIDGELVTIWDFDIDGPYRVVADAMAEYVHACSVENIFLHNEHIVGTASNRQLLEDKSVKTWDHFYVNLPNAAVVKGTLIGPALGEYRTTFDVMTRSIKEISFDAIDAVLELIDQNSLYRGEEHKFAVTEFRKLKKQACKAKNPGLFVWENATIPASVSRIRNTVIGTLLTDISEGKELEDAVKAFEAKVAPQNYKRPTALVTKAMIVKAQETVNELGLATALERRYATIEDITVNNILFADRTAKREMNVFEEIAAGTSVDVKKLGKVEEVPVDDFVSKILPSARTLEVLFENRHAGNLVSLVAPVDQTAKPLFKWPNGFSWSYAGDLADSIKEKVKKAGGNVTGDFRASLAWYNFDDLDLHLKQPGHRDEIFFGRKVDPTTGGNLDVDMNAGSGTTRTPVENITYPSRARMTEGTYTLFVNNYCRRESDNPGFEIEMEFDGTIYGFGWQKSIKTGDNVVVCKFNYSRREGLTILESLPSTQATRTLWGLPTQTFHKVRVAMFSPNYWDARTVGNKHFFFMLEGCVNEDKARGFFNEFLSESLTPHRKVLEIVGAKMKTDESTSQLSGIGFSSTQRNYILCRITGAISRTVKVLI